MSDFSPPQRIDTFDLIHHTFSISFVITFGMMNFLILKCICYIYTFKKVNFDQLHLILKTPKQNKTVKTKTMGISKCPKMSPKVKRLHQDNSAENIAF